MSTTLTVTYPARSDRMCLLTPSASRITVSLIKMPTKAHVRKPTQQSLPLPTTWGGKRVGAGRKPNGPKAGVPHRTRPYHDRAQPVHLTLRTVSTLPNLREARVFPAIREAIRRASKGRFRVVHLPGLRRATR